MVDWWSSRWVVDEDLRMRRMQQCWGIRRPLGKRMIGVYAMEVLGMTRFVDGAIVHDAAIRKDERTFCSHARRP